MKVLLDENLDHRLRKNLGSLTGRRLAIVALSSVEWRILKNYLPQINAAIDSAVPGSFQAVECGAFNRKKSIDE